MNNLDPWIARNDLETDGIPIIPAATMILLDDRPDLQVLMLLRNDASGFVASHTIFLAERLNRTTEVLRGIPSFQV